MCVGPEIALVAQLVAATAAVGGTAYSVVQGQKASAASQRAEGLRQQQMRNEFIQKQRAAIRQSQLSRATSIANISGQTGTLQNSAYGGATSANSAQLGTQLGELGQAFSIGSDMFAANAEYSQASANAQTGQAVSNFGKDLFASGPAIGRVGSTLFSGQPS